MDKVRPMLLELTDKFPNLKGSNLEGVVKGNIGNGLRIIGRVLRGLLSNGFALINLISLILITPVVTFYMLRDWNIFVEKFS